MNNKEDHRYRAVALKELYKEKGKEVSLQKIKDAILEIYNVPDNGNRSLDGNLNGQVRSLAPMGLAKNPNRGYWILTRLGYELVNLCSFSDDYLIECIASLSSKEIKVSIEKVNDNLYVESVVEDLRAKSAYNDYESCLEGDRKKIVSWVYERKKINRDNAIIKRKELGKPIVCEACGFDFAKVYGSLGNGFIEVHHNLPLCDCEDSYIPDPLKDLDLVCSNCHRMIHRQRNVTLSVKDIKKILNKK